MYGEVKLFIFVMVRIFSVRFFIFIGGGVIVYFVKYIFFVYLFLWRLFIVFRNIGILFGEIDVVFEFWIREFGSVKEKIWNIVKNNEFCVFM